jgi:hypothetical protein
MLFVIICAHYCLNLIFFATPVKQFSQAYGKYFFIFTKTIFNYCDIEP